MPPRLLPHVLRVRGSAERRPRASFPPCQPFLRSKARRKGKTGLKHLTPHLCVLSCCPKRAQTAFKTPTPCPLHFRPGRSTLCFRSGALGSAAISGNWAQCHERQEHNGVRRRRRMQTFMAYKCRVRLRFDSAVLNFEAEERHKKKWRSPRFCGHPAFNKVAKWAADPPGDPVLRDSRFFLFSFKGAASWEN